jgi:pimeloyl-ACP methyl ester carboxylesterase
LSKATIHSFVVGTERPPVCGLLLVAPDIGHGSEATVLPPRTVIVKSKHAAGDDHSLERRIFESELVVQTDEALNILREDVVPAFEMVDSALLDKLSDKYTLSLEDEMRTQILECPSLFVMGRQDHQTGYHNVWSINENYPRATFAVLDRAGHTVGAIEQVELCTSLIGEWLDRVDENLLM